MEWAVGLVIMRSPMLSDLWGEVGGGVWGGKEFGGCPEIYVAVFR